MADVDELVALFHSMDDEAQEFTLATARDRARQYPRQRPLLRLVAAQPGNVSFRSESSGALDFVPAPIS